MLFTGVGKISATYHLTKAIQENKPSIIINLGTAGSNKFRRKSVICCTQFVQRDMDASTLGFEKYETPFAREPNILDVIYRI